jgi:hypothetical protein
MYTDPRILAIMRKAVVVLPDPATLRTIADPVPVSTKSTHACCKGDRVIGLSVIASSLIGAGQKRPYTK